MIRSCLSLLFIACAAWAEPADVIWTAHYVVTMDSAHRLIRNGAVALRGERIAGVGARSEVERQFQAPQHVDRGDTILMPGLINTHTHAAMSLLRGIADDLKLEEWLTKYIFPAEAKNVSADFVSWGTRLACAEMMLSGTTTFTDMYYFEDRVAEAAKEAGMRGVLGETMIGFPVADAKAPAYALHFTESYMQRYAHDPLITPAIAPHALYTNSPADLKAARALANKYNAPLLIHLEETREDNAEAQKKYGMSAAQALDSMGVLDGRTLVAHGVWLDDADSQLLLRKHTGIAHCPSSNMKLGSGVAPVVKWLKLGLAVGLGTDGPAGSNNDFDLMEEMNLAADLQKVNTGDPRSLPAEQSVAMATIGGARALGMDKEIGSLESGKRADFIVLRLDRPHAVPMYNVYSQIVYALKGSDVTDMVVNGKPVVRDARVLTLNMDIVLQKAREYGQKIADSLK